MTEWSDDRIDELNDWVKEGFANVDKRFEQVDKRFEQVDERFVRLEGEMKEGFANVDKRFEQVDERFVRLEVDVRKGFAKVGERFDKGDERFSTREEMSEVRADMRLLNQRFDRLYYLILVTVVGLAGSLLASNVWG